MELNRRLRSTPPYFLMDLIRLRDRLVSEGVDLVDFSLGDPDLPAPAPVVAAIQRAAADPRNHRYPAAVEGMPAFRRAMADYYARRFGVTLDPDREVCSLLGSKEGLAHLIWAVLDEGDVCLLPDPAYPIYLAQARIAGAAPHLMPLTAENGFLPDFEAIPPDVAARAKLMILNYPNNPTGAVADLAFFERAVAFCRRHGILLAHDNAYADNTFDGFSAPSVLEVPGAGAVAVEFYSFSKPFNMAGFRLAALVGNADAVGALRQMKTNTDNGVAWSVQHGGVAALSLDVPGWLSRLNGVYARRRDLMVSGLRAMGYAAPMIKGTFYLWLPVPQGFTAAGWTQHVLERAQVLLGPGVGYGEHGEGYVRIALTQPEERIQLALDRLRRL